MHVFVTGASGWVGTPTVRELLKAGHKVTGLARSEASASAIGKAGADVLRGSLDDLDVLSQGAETADGVIHTAFNHDFSKFRENCEQDARAIKVMGDALAGSGKPFIATSGVALLNAAGTATEETPIPAPSQANPRFSEQTVLATASKGVRAMAVRLPPTTHGKGDQGFTTMMISIARQKGFAAYVGEGENHWTAVHRLDAAKVFRLALEKGAAGACYHAVAEEGIPMRAIAEAIGRGLGLPVKSLTPNEAADYYGWFCHFATLNNRASSEQTKMTLGWVPTHQRLLVDLAEGHYFSA